MYTYIYTHIYRNHKKINYDFGRLRQAYLEVVVYIITYIVTYIHTYIHTYIYTYIHTYIHTYICIYLFHYDFGRLRQAPPEVYIFGYIIDIYFYIDIYYRYIIDIYFY